AARVASALAAGLLGPVLPAPARSRSSVLRWRGLRRPASVLSAAQLPTPVRWDDGNTPPPSAGARAPICQTPGSGPEPAARSSGGQPARIDARYTSHVRVCYARLAL